MTTLRWQATNNFPILWQFPGWVSVLWLEVHHCCVPYDNCFRRHIISDENVMSVKIWWHSLNTDREKKWRARFTIDGSLKAPGTWSFSKVSWRFNWSKVKKTSSSYTASDSTHAKPEICTSLQLMVLHRKKKGESHFIVLPLRENHSGLCKMPIFFSLRVMN